MNEMFGMDIEQIHALSAQLDGAGREVEQVITALTKGLSTTPWTGNDRSRFEHDWLTTHTAGLRNAALALHQAAQASSHHAEEQRRASGSGGGGGF